MTKPTPILAHRTKPVAAAPSTSAFASVVTGAAAIRARNTRLRTLRMAVEDQASAIRLPAPPPATTPLPETNGR